MQAAEGRWIRTRKQIENDSPSRKDGIPLRVENSQRRLALAFCEDVGRELKMEPLTIGTAATYWQRFFLYQSLAKNDGLLLASACILLAGKVREDFRSLKAITVASYFLRSKKEEAAAQRIKDEKRLAREKFNVTQAEDLLLKTLDFDLVTSQAENHIWKLLKEVAGPHTKGDKNKLAFFQIAVNFCNDSRKTTLCLQAHTGFDVALACINLASTVFKYPLPSRVPGKPWWARYNIPKEAMKDIEHQIMAMYTTKGPGSSSQNPNSVSCSRVIALTPNTPSLPSSSAGPSRLRGPASPGSNTDPESVLPVPGESSAAAAAGREVTTEAPEDEQHKSAGPLSTNLPIPTEDQVKAGADPHGSVLSSQAGSLILEEGASGTKEVIARGIETAASRSGPPKFDVEASGSGKKRKKPSSPDTKLDGMVREAGFSTNQHSPERGTGGESERASKAKAAGIKHDSITEEENEGEEEGEAEGEGEGDGERKGKGDGEGVGEGAGKEMGEAERKGTTEGEMCDRMEKEAQAPDNSRQDPHSISGEETLTANDEGVEGRKEHSRTDEIAEDGCASDSGKGSLELNILSASENASVLPLNGLGEEPKSLENSDGVQGEGMEGFGAPSFPRAELSGGKEPLPVGPQEKFEDAASPTLLKNGKHQFLGRSGSGKKEGIVKSSAPGAEEKESFKKGVAEEEGRRNDGKDDWVVGPVISAKGILKLEPEGEQKSAGTTAEGADSGLNDENHEEAPAALQVVGASSLKSEGQRKDTPAKKKRRHTSSSDSKPSATKIVAGTSSSGKRHEGTRKKRHLEGKTKGAKGEAKGAHRGGEEDLSGRSSQEDGEEGRKRRRRGGEESSKVMKSPQAVAAATGAVVAMTDATVSAVEGNFADGKASDAMGADFETGEKGHKKLSDPIPPEGEQQWERPASPFAGFPGGDDVEIGEVSLVPEVSSPSSPVVFSAIPDERRPWVAPTPREDGVDELPEADAILTRRSGRGDGERRGGSPSVGLNGLRCEPASPGSSAGSGAWRSPKLWWMGQREAAEGGSMEELARPGMPVAMV
eukprot:TRINITY_DN35768_c0_g1_i1.p1 TRINITY_DN35768_c0_g1~~TRINITY_DN35768_c0_g1_i1.p1  ORF type:complete len:1051 (+),score=256.98 TRINITY_DN35768_c0_g1_i1:207-3359(+)